MAWPFRRALIEQQLNVLDADIICLEEVDHYKDFFHPKLTSLGYSGQFLEKLDSPCLKFDGNNGPDGVAMFVKTDKFDIIESYAEYLHEENGERGNQGFLLKVLVHKPSKRSFVVCVTHLKAKRDFHARRLAQTKKALEILEKQVSEKYNDLPIIWCGDFNGETSESFYKEIAQSKIGFQSSYKSFNGCEPDFTTWKIRPTYEEKRTIDYIWFTEKQLKVVDVLCLMKEDDVPQSRFPSSTHPSDHVCLCVDYDFL